VRKEHGPRELQLCRAEEQGARAVGPRRPARLAQLLRLSGPRQRARANGPRVDLSRSKVKRKFLFYYFQKLLNWCFLLSFDAKSFSNFELT
jgi:hypothetical protein